MNSCQKSGGCVYNTRTHELVPKNRRFCLQHTNSRSHELVPKIRWLCLQHMNARTHEHTILKKKDAALVFVASTHKVTNSLFSKKMGCWVCLLELTNSRKVTKITSSWLEAKMSLLFLYFQSVQVTNSRTWDCWLEFVSSCVHNPNRLSLNLFGIDWYDTFFQPNSCSVWANKQTILRTYTLHKVVLKAS